MTALLRSRRMQLKHQQDAEKSVDKEKYILLSVTGSIILNHWMNKKSTFRTCTMWKYYVRSHKCSSNISNWMFCLLLDKTSSLCTIQSNSLPHTVDICIILYPSVQWDELKYAQLHRFHLIQKEMSQPRDAFNSTERFKATPQLNRAALWVDV